eukprot:CAMPEP_0206201166 /NCGR_PEP_ID=MMETSP0166-20121206/11350_1 /ASSEMBLY_ACC=CAM_ASM_000260 /TAXON_ID=95228 /ORGANISM="Vannella robusta, Strain DIVA3 518/3/11/1/6" /LENGTH=236 /DNA_ID=CAMNT_0053619717 /DNA_START=42 /DNA_END=755 /DNA_ORIENTATION=-
MVRDIVSISKNESGYSAVVAGSNNYHINIILTQGTDVICDCSCPDRRGGYCKHTCVVLSQLVGGTSSSSFSSNVVTHVSPVKTTSNVYSSPTSSLVASNVGASLLNELGQLANNFAQTNDGSLLAKIACTIYKNCKEAISNAKYNPNRSLEKLIPLVSFCSQRSHLFSPPSTQLSATIETVARACSHVLIYATDKGKIEELRRLSSARNWFSSSATAYWQDISEIASRTLKTSALN